MLLSPAEFDAKQVNKAIKGLGTDESALVEVILSRTNAQLTAMKEAYKTSKSIFRYFSPVYIYTTENL